MSKVKQAENKNISTAKMYGTDCLLLPKCCSDQIRESTNNQQTERAVMEQDNGAYQRQGHVASRDQLVVWCWMDELQWWSQSKFPRFVTSVIRGANFFFFFFCLFEKEEKFASQKFKFGRALQKTEPQ